MLQPYPISLLQFGLFWVVVVLGSIALLRAFAASRERGGLTKKSGFSTVGIAGQTLAFFGIGFGQLRVAVPWWTPSSLLCSMLVALLGGSAIAIFIAATKALGKNWSVVARTRSDHQLVRTGPFAVVRHPIYLALIALPLYIAGTIIRIREEEVLLRAQFGEEHARYVREVPAFIPLIG